MNAASQILSAEQMRSAEQALIERGVSVGELMERAGRGAAEFVWRMAAGRPVTVLVGPGNNGGDGYVIARVLAERGASVSVVAPLGPGSEAARAARERWGGAPIAFARGHVLVDCLFGTGLTRKLSDELRSLLQKLAAAHEVRIAIDLPSGVDSDSGALLNEGLPRYELTIALGAWKFAHWTMPASARMGERRLVEIGIDPVPGAARLSRQPSLQVPAAGAHKYSRGLLAVIGGAMPGAGVLAARAAMHSGAGYVKLFAEHRSPATPDELVVDDAPLNKALADERIDALLIGPGLGRSKDGKAILISALHADLPTVCDADALTLLEPGMLDGRSAPLVLTPHAGELTHLCQAWEIGEGQRRARALELARATHAVVVAKGPDTLIAGPDGLLLIAPPAPSWLSTAGTGDVLAGMTASRLATGVDPVRACEQAVWLHGEAARRAGSAFIVGQLIENISSAYASCL